MSAVPLPGQVGRLNGIRAEPGTILGPDTGGQWFAVLACDEDGATVRYATTADLDAAVGPEPRSVAEHRLLRTRPHREREQV